MIRSFPINKGTLITELKCAQSASPEKWQFRQAEDQIISEQPLEIWLKQASSANTPSKALLQSTESLMTTMRSPGDDINLVRGWLHSSGLLGNKEQLQTIAHTGSEQLKHGHSNQVLITLKPQIRLDIEDHRRLEYASSSCGVCGQQSIEALLDKLPTDSAVFDGHLDLSDIYPLSQSLRNNQPAFAQTGGNHGAGLFELVKGLRPELLDVREDVGRHNALDKLIGANLSKLTDGPGFYGVVLSGRVSFDLVQKAAMANIKFIIAIGAPSSLAIELANECDICVVGFVKETSLNLYSAKHYIEMQTTTIDPLQEPYRESK